MPDANVFENVEAAIKLAKLSDKPNLIVCHTQIGYGSPKQGLPSAHGEPLGEDNIRALKKALKWCDTEPMSFAVPDEVYKITAKVAEKGAKTEAEWNKLFEKWSEKYPELRKEWDIWHSDELPVDLLNDAEYWAFEGKAATRNSSGTVVNRLA